MGHDLGSALSMLGTSPDLDLLSVDVNGPEYIVWSKLGADAWRPRVICIEYDSSRGPRENSIPHRGPSIRSLYQLGQARNYSLVHVNGINAFFVRGPVLSALRNQKRISFLHVDDPDTL